jgi:ribonuclease HI
MEDPTCTARRTFYLLDEWRVVNTGPSPVTNRPVEHWLPPAEGWTKINTDGAFSKDSETGDRGVVLRDHHGSFISGACHFFSLVSEPEQAELLACRMGLQLAKSLGLRKVVLETDCATAVVKMVDKELDRSIHGSIVEEIKGLLQDFEEVRVKHVRRSGNMVAHKLAKFSCIDKSCNRWVVVPPEYIVETLASDYAGI